MLSAESATLGLVLADGGLAPLCWEVGRSLQRILFWHGDCRGEGPVRDIDVSLESQRIFEWRRRRKSRRTLQT